MTPYWITMSARTAPDRKWHRILLLGIVWHVTMMVMSSRLCFRASRNAYGSHDKCRDLSREGPSLHDIVAVGHVSTRKQFLRKLQRLMMKSIWMQRPSERLPRRCLDRNMGLLLTSESSRRHIQERGSAWR